MRRPRRPGPPPTQAAAPPENSPAAPPPFWGPARLGLVVAALLIGHGVLAARSLIEENPTVDEVVHLPAGVTYWQRGTFRLYHHNPPLVKMVAALPVVWAGPEMGPAYQSASWSAEPPDQTTFAHVFMYLNATRYFELFTLARLMMPLFSILGGLIVFAWSRRLFGDWGGLLSLALWSCCPNVLAHARLVTTDLGATALGVAATYTFWRYLHRPTWVWALASGVVLGLAELAKFSMVLLYAIGPILWLAHVVMTYESGQLARRLARSIGQGGLIVALSLVTIAAGYRFEGVGEPLGRFEFACRTLTRPVEPGTTRPTSRNPLLEWAWRRRVNRFRGTPLAGLPVPLPRQYVLGFDEQKLEAEGLEGEGYPVYLNGELRRSGWWDYYVLTLAYKVPEGTWALILLAGAAALISRRARAPWADEVALIAVPVVVLGAMSFGTDINLGLRYVLPLFPYVFISVGRLAPGIAGLGRRGKWVAGGIAGASLAATVAATLSIHPHYLAYFNWASGGPDRRPPHLIDSNLDWGQDLVRLQRWARENAPGKPIGLVYFGQVHPGIFRLRDEPFPWFLPPAVPGMLDRLPGPSPPLVGPAARLEPGLYAISASLLQGLPWRLYDPNPEALLPAWRMNRDWARNRGPFDYFRDLEPTAILGHSILIYEVTPAQAEQLNRRWRLGS